MTAQPIMLSQHAMHYPITGLGSNAITVCNAVKTICIKEPAKAQKDTEGEGRDFSGSLA